MSTLRLVNFKKIAISKIAIIAVIGIYNSMVVNSTQFMADHQELMSFKRLDEINGKVQIGKRSIAFIPMEEKKEIVVKEQPKVKKIAKVEEVKPVARVEISEPAITEDLSLTLTTAFHNGPISGDIKGSVRTIDGTVEEIFVSLPNGQNILIQTRDRMEGNVFRYFDNDNGEERSGMFYEVKKGVYMITLVNDTNYAGARFEFKADEELEVAYRDEDKSQTNWNINEQNNEVDTKVQQDQVAEGEESERTPASNTQNYSFNF